MYHSQIYDKIRDIVEETDDDPNDNAWSANLNEHVLQIMKMCWDTQAQLRLLWRVMQLTGGRVCTSEHAHLLAWLFWSESDF